MKLNLCCRALLFLCFFKLLDAPSCSACKRNSDCHKGESCSTVRLPVDKKVCCKKDSICNGVCCGKGEKCHILASGHKICCKKCNGVCCEKGETCLPVIPGGGYLTCCKKTSFCQGGDDMLVCCAFGNSCQWDGAKGFNTCLPD